MPHRFPPLTPAETTATRAPHTLLPWGEVLSFGLVLLLLAVT